MAGEIVCPWCGELGPLKLADGTIAFLEPGGNFYTCRCGAVGFDSRWLLKALRDRQPRVLAQVRDLVGAAQDVPPDRLWRYVTKPEPGDRLLWTKRGTSPPGPSEA